jgi:hypothetical protein
MKIQLVQISTAALVMLMTLEYSHAALVSDDFESGDLNNWVIGGRQMGTHTANVVTCDTGSQCGHLYQSGSFTEINMSQTFLFDPTDTFNFDMKVNVGTTTPPASNYYGISGVSFSFLDADDSMLGSVWYLASTTDYPFTNWVDSTRSVNEITENVWHHFDLDTSSILSQISIDQSEIASTQVLFETYSSTWPYPTVTAELWVDNVNTSVVPIPAAGWLFFSGLLGLLGLRRRIITPRA